MSFPPATEMFQFAGFASRTYEFSPGYSLLSGLPHSEIQGSTIARISPWLFAACHVLHRLSVPRHPPDALTSTLDRKTRRLQGQAPRNRSRMKTLKGAAGSRPSAIRPQPKPQLPNSLPLHPSKIETGRRTRRISASPDLALEAAWWR
jgi:hypothetical protein